MAVDRHAPTRRRGEGARQPAGRPVRDGHAARGGLGSSLIGGGADGNRLLTAQTGAVLIVLLFVLGITILRVKQLLSIHMFLGMLLIGPVALKMASTGYRFARYYARSPRYRRAGPPPPLLRMLAPLVVLSTIAVFATGAALLFVGPRAQGNLIFLHKASFVVWIAVTAVHVIGHIVEMPGALGRRREGQAARRLREAMEQLPGMRSIHASAESSALAWDARGTGRTGRMICLAGAAVGGLVLAIVSVAWFAPWLHWAQTQVMR